MLDRRGGVGRHKPLPNDANDGFSGPNTKGPNRRAFRKGTAWGGRSGWKEEAKVRNQNRIRWKPRKQGITSPTIHTILWLMGWMVVDMVVQLLAKAHRSIKSDQHHIHNIVLVSQLPSSDYLASIPKVKPETPAAAVWTISYYHMQL